MSFTEIMYKGFLGYYLGETGTQSGLAFLMMSALGFLVVVLASYLLGSCNFAIIISGKLFKEDIRTYGSGNAGMTNMLRTYGKRAAVYTLLGDSMKAVVSVILGYVLLGNAGSFCAAFFCILGHVFPVYYKFKGGKGVITAGIAILLTDPPVFLILFAVFLVIVIGTRYVSLGSIMAMLMYPLILERMRQPGIHVIFAILTAATVVFMHRSNIQRLRNKEESKISFKSRSRSKADVNSPDRGEDEQD